MTESPSHRVRQRKRAMRRAVIDRRDRLTVEERRARSERIAERALSLSEVRSAAVVMAFWSFGSEVDTSSLIERLHATGKRVVLPRVDGDEVVAVEYAPGDPVAAAAFGAMEPTGLEVVEPRDVDVVIVPAVALDRRGARVGYGGGFYDRFLARTRPDVAAIAVAFAIQVVDDVPEGRGDRRVDAIVTEDEVIRCRST